jgi:hypothetical protein
MQLDIISNIGVTEKDFEILALQEDEIRKSQWYIDECTRVKNIPNGWMDVTANVQKEIVSKYCEEKNKENFCDIIIYYLRRAHHLFPENKIFKERIQVKYNRANIGSLKIEDNIPSSSFINDKIKDGINMFIGSSMT